MSLRKACSGGTGCGPAKGNLTHQALQNVSLLPCKDPESEEQPKACHQ